MTAEPNAERMQGIIEALDRGEAIHPIEGSWLVDQLVAQHTRWLALKFCYSEPNQTAFYGEHDSWIEAGTPNPCPLCARRIGERYPA